MGLEDQIQAKCYQWLHNHHPELRGLFFAIPNGGYRDIREAAKLKATGVVPGVPDTLLVWPVLAGFEFKTPTGRESAAQRDVFSAWHKKKIPVHVVRSEEQFKNLIESILSDAETAK